MKETTLKLNWNTSHKQARKTEKKRDALKKKAYRKRPQPNSLPFPTRARQPSLHLVQPKLENGHTCEDCLCTKREFPLFSRLFFSLSPISPLRCNNSFAPNPNQLVTNNPDKSGVGDATVCSSNVTYRSKLDWWPRHVTPSEKRPFFDVITLFATYILGQKVDPMRNVTSSHSRFLLVLSSFLTLLLYLNSFWSRFGP